MSNTLAAKRYHGAMEDKVRTLQDQKSSAQIGAKAAEDRFKDLLRQKETLSDERSQAHEALAVLQAEKKGGEDLARQAERTLQMRVTTLEQALVDERASLTARAEAADAMGKEMQKHVYGAYAEALAANAPMTAWADRMGAELKDYIAARRPGTI